MRDHNYDDAVTDLRGALEHSGGAYEVQESLDEALRAQSQWRCVDPEDEKVWWHCVCGTVCVAWHGMACVI